MTWNYEGAFIARSLFKNMVVKFPQREIYSFNHVQVSNSVTLNTLKMLCNHHYYLVPEWFPHLKREPHTQPLSSLVPLPITGLLSASMDLAVLECFTYMESYSM